MAEASGGRSWPLLLGMFPVSTAGSCCLACFQSIPNSFDISAWCFGESEHNIHTCNGTYLQSQKERIIGVPFWGFGDLLNLSFALKPQICIYIIQFPEFNHIIYTWLNSGNCWSQVLQLPSTQQITSVIS